MQNSNGFDKVYLISLSSAGEAGTIIKAVTVRITHNVLRRSIDDLVEVEMFPGESLSRDDFISGVRSIAVECRSLSSLIGISVMTNDYHLLREVSQIFRSESPETPIIAGGPHFVDRGRNGSREIMDSTALTSLKSGTVDAVNIGEGSGLREIILGAGNGDIRFIDEGNGFFLDCPGENIPEGIRCRGADGSIRGRGKGRMPRINYGNPYIIPIRYRRGIGANFNLSNSCPNNCSYCNSPKHKFGLQVKSYFDELSRIIPGKRITILQANDNHPLERCNRQKTFEFLDTFRRKYNATPVLYNFFIDPSTLLEGKGGYIRRFMMELSEGNHQFQFGRECTDEKVAKALGRNHQGTARDQKRLDAEGEAIRDLASGLPETRFKVFYIITPFETEHSVLKTIAEIKSFRRSGNIYTGSNMLWPLPGSRNRIRYRGKYFPFEDMPAEIINNLRLITPVEINFWHRDLPAGDFMDYLMGAGVKMFLEPEMPNNTSYHLSMMELIASIAFGSYRPGNTVRDIISNTRKSSSSQPGDISPNFKDRILKVGNHIDNESLYEVSLNSKIRLSRLIRENFWLWERPALDIFCEELRTLYQFRDSYLRGKQTAGVS